MHIHCNELYFSSRPDCPVCKSDQFDVIFHCAFTSNPVRGFIDSHYRDQGEIDWGYLEGTDYVLCDCHDCELIYQKNIPNLLMLEQIYNVMIAPASLKELEMRRLTLEHFNRIAGELDVLFRMVRKHPTEIRLLDYGFGYGRWARVALAMGAQVFATEISPEKILYAGKMGVGILGDNDLHHMRFDIVHTEQVFEHLTEPAREFSLLASALTADGIMKVAAPPQGKIRALLKAHGMIDRSPQEHLWKADQFNRVASRYRDYISVIPLEHLNAYAPKTFDYLARRNKLKLISQVRRESVPISTIDTPTLGRSLFHLSKVLLRSLVRPDSGYYIFARTS